MFDYPHRQLMLEPYVTPVASFDSDMSGMFLIGGARPFIAKREPLAPRRELD